jgi:hypothetical protein
VRFGEANLGGPGLTNGSCERCVVLNLDENCFQFAQLLYHTNHFFYFVHQSFFNLHLSISFWVTPSITPINFYFLEKRIKKGNNSCDWQGRVGTRARVRMWWVKKQGDSVETISTTLFFSSRGLVKQIWVVWRDKWCSCERWVDLNLSENYFQFTQLF